MGWGFIGFLCAGVTYPAPPTTVEALLTRSGRCDQAHGRGLLRHFHPLDDALRARTARAVFPSQFRGFRAFRVFSAIMRETTPGPWFAPAGEDRTTRPPRAS